MVIEYIVSANNQNHFNVTAHVLCTGEAHILRSCLNLLCCFIWMIDRVFGSDSTTKQVYEEGAKEVALSVVSGINCESIFSLLSLLLFSIVSCQM